MTQMRETLRFMSSNRLDAKEDDTVQTPDALMQQVALGHEAAFELLYDAMASRVFGLVLRVLRDNAQSEEVTQEVFVEAWQHARRFDPVRGGLCFLAFDHCPSPGGGSGPIEPSEPGSGLAHWNQGIPGQLRRCRRKRHPAR